VLRKQDIIISAVNSRVRRTSHKYGIEVPTSVKHAIEIDRKNKNTFWADVLKKEWAMCVLPLKSLVRMQEYHLRCKNGFYPESPLG